MWNGGKVEEGKRGRGEKGKRGKGEEGKRGRGEEGKRGRGVKWLNAKSLNLLLTTDYCLLSFMFNIYLCKNTK